MQSKSTALDYDPKNEFDLIQILNRNKTKLTLNAINKPTNQKSKFI